MESKERMHRLFFALWPSDALRDQLASEVAPMLQGKRARPIPPQNFHITLAFLGAVEAHRVPSVIEAAGQVEERALQFRLERVEAWPGSHVLCLTPDHCVPLHRLAERLRFNLLAHHLEADQKVFRPHVTIAREWRERSVESTIGPFDWSAHEFVLVESEAGRNGSEYRIVGRWPLSNTTQD